jgi:F-type H+-transporting ATPase subunit b
MRWVALPRMGGVIERRQQRVNDDLAMAQRLKAQTEKAIADYEAALAAARAKGHAIAQAARDKLAGESAEERTRLEAELNAQVAAAEKTIAKAKAKAMADIDKVSADLAGEIVAELAGLAWRPQGGAKSERAVAARKREAE